MDSDSSESSILPVKPKAKRPAPAKALEALAKARQVRFEKKKAAMEAKKAEKEQMANAVAACTLPKEEPPVPVAPTVAPPAPPPVAPDPVAELTRRLDALLQERTAAPPKPVKRATRKPKPAERSSDEEVVVRRKKKPVQRDTDYLAYKAAQIQQQLERDERNRLKNLFLR
jgi:hypothetical protein